MSTPFPIEPLRNGEINLAINSDNIFGEMKTGLAAWKRLEDKSLFHATDGFGNGKRIPLTHQYFSSVSIHAGTEFIVEESGENPSLDLSSSFRLNDKPDGVPKNDPDRGYINDTKAQQLIDSLEKKGCRDIALRPGFGLNRGISFTVNGQPVYFNIGYSSYAEFLKKNTLQPPISEVNYSFDIKVTDLDKSGEISQGDFAKACDALTLSTKAVLQSLSELNSVPTPAISLELDSKNAQLKKDQISHGFVTSDYLGGEYDHHGMPAEGIYDEIDHMAWLEHQSHIIDNRGWGNRQTLVMNQDRLVFGRWGGTGPTVNQADVMIDVSPDPLTHKILHEFGISRRHFALEFDERLNEKIRKDTADQVTEAVVVEELNSHNGLTILRKSNLGRSMLGAVEVLPDQSNPLEKRRVSVLFPGDVILVGNAGNEPTPTTTAAEKRKYVAVVYLGQRKFVQVNIDASKDRPIEDVSTELALIVKNETDDFDKAKLSTEPLDSESIVAAAVEFMETPPASDPIPPATPSVVKLDVQTAVSMDWNTLLEQMAILETDGDKATNALLITSAVALARPEPEVAGFAVMKLLSIPPVEGLTPEILSKVLSQQEVWQKLSPATAIQAAEKLSKMELPAETKSQILNAAYSGRDDFVRAIIRNLPGFGNP